MLENNNQYYCIDSLIVDTYVIGYYPQGESLVNIIKCDGIPIFSFIIDSYKSRNTFVTTEILKKEKINKINLFCWTHPHNDHSAGIDELLKGYVNCNTDIWIPERSNELDANICENSKQLYLKLKEETRKRTEKYRVHSVSDKKDMLYYQDLKRIMHNGTEYGLKMNSYAPNSMNTVFIENNNYFNVNEESIIFSFSIGEVSFLFSGDANNEEIENIPKNALPEFIYFNKIPHHGSETSNSLLDYINNGYIACSTIYKTGNSDLPDINVLNKYKEKFSEVYCTCKNKKTRVLDYGCIHICTDIINRTYMINTFGLADKW